MPHYTWDTWDSGFNANLSNPPNSRIDLTNELRALSNKALPGDYHRLQSNTPDAIVLSLAAWNNMWIYDVLRQNGEALAFVVCDKNLSNFIRCYGDRWNIVKNIEQATFFRTLDETSVYDEKKVGDFMNWPTAWVFKLRFEYNTMSDGYTYAIPKVESQGPYRVEMDGEVCEDATEDIGPLPEIPL